MTDSEGAVFFRQLLVGPMQNFVYLIGCPRSRECLVVDPAWDIDEILGVAGQAGYTVTGALVTHYHPDHVGGSFFGFQVPGGITDLLEKAPEARIHVNRVEADGLKKITGVSDTDMVKHDSDEEILVGDVPIRLIHTPGHTPGSQCFLVDGCLVSGDTLFVQGCGRVDLPGANPEDMYYSLTRKLANMPDDTVLYPGHHYSPEKSASMADVRATNHYLRLSSLEDWMRLMG